MSGSDLEPNVPPPEAAAAQMREATERLRDQAWMVAPLTTAPPLAASSLEVDLDT